MLKFETAKAKTDAGEKEYQRITVDPEDADVSFENLVEFFQTNRIPIGYEKVKRGRVKEGEEQGVPGLINFAIRGYNQKAHSDKVLEYKAPVDPVEKEAERMFSKGLHKSIPFLASCKTADEVAAKLRGSVEETPAEA